MTDISADKVKELREKTGAGIMDCKRALAASGGDLAQAIDFLRKEGVVKAAKKAGRATLEGLVAIGQSPDRRSASLVEVNCETDFVARTDQFQEFLSSVSELIVQKKPKDLNGLLALPFGGSSLQEALSQLIARIGENMAIRRFRLIGGDPGDQIGAYIHAGSKIGAVVRVRGNNLPEGISREIAMHVAAMTPHYVDRKEVPPRVVEREKEIARSSPEVAGKPEHLLDRILEGKLNRYFGEVCLVEQPFIKDPTGKKTVGAYLQEKAPGAAVAEMVRFQVGEEAS
jgi:elongation factor Ts